MQEEICQFLVSNMLFLKAPTTQDSLLKDKNLTGCLSSAETSKLVKEV